VEDKDARDFVLPPIGAPKLIDCEEDEEFRSAFDKMLNENIAESRNATVPKGQQVSIVAPVNRNRQQQQQQQQQKSVSPEGKVKI